MNDQLPDHGSSPVTPSATLRYIGYYPESLRERGHKALGPDPAIHPSARIVDSYVGGWTELGPNTTLLESTFGDYSYAAGDVSIVYADVGRFCSIASHVRINPGNHPMQRVTQHHLTYRRAQYGLGEQDDAEFFNWRRAHRCTIGHDVWLGHGAIVMPGVTVGIGAVVGSGAVVTKDVAPYTVVVGVPAQPKRQRFPDAVAAALLRSGWWEWDRATLEARFDDLLEIDRFVERYG
jgi:phosphonate metabolism protein (transferase hexapeptide repeat family)